MSETVTTNAIDLDLLARLLINENLVKMDDIKDDDVPGLARSAISMLLKQKQEQAAELTALQAVADAVQDVLFNCSGKGDGYVVIEAIYTEKLLDKYIALKGVK